MPNMWKEAVNMDYRELRKLKNEIIAKKQQDRFRSSIISGIAIIKWDNR